MSVLSVPNNPISEFINCLVILYRAGLVTAAASFVACASTAYISSDSDLESFSNVLLHQISNFDDLFYVVGCCGLGLSLYLIHIYISEIKLTLQAIWAVGVIGSLATYFLLALPAGDHSLVRYVVAQPFAVWFVGPVFAALTGLVFKEGLCYGKLEAAILTFVIPALLLGHLYIYEQHPILPLLTNLILGTNQLDVNDRNISKTGLMDEGTKLTLLGFWMALFVVFAGRKFTQPIKDDIGDKSVFMFNSLPEEGKRALLTKLQQQQNFKDDLEG
ncbi:hypothetical protein V2J09_019913 [Rumex salicifolius]